MNSGANNLRVKIIHNIRELPAEEWERIFPPSLENYYFYKTVDESGLEQFRFYYVLIYAGEKLAGLVPFFLMDYQLDMAVQGRFKRLTKALKKIFPRLLSMRVLFCGVPMGQGRLGVDKNIPGVLEAAYQAMEKLAAQEKAFVYVFKEFNPSYAELFEFLKAKGFVRTQSLPTTVINIDFDSFEGYLKTLSASSREGIRRKLKKMKQNPPMELSITDSLSREEAKQVRGLYWQTASEASVEFEELNEDFFFHIGRNMRGEAKFFLWRLEGRLVSFALCLVKGDYFVDYYLGFDYSVAYQYNLYLVRFQDLMNWCLEHKMKVYEMGQSGYEAKRRLGFKFKPLYIYSKPRCKFLVPFFGLYNRFFMFENNDPVFKEMQSQEQA